MSTSKPLVSVIIPTYGVPARLEKAIESVFKQTYKNIELIVVDDNNPGSNARNKTRDIVNKLLKSGNKLYYLEHEKNLNGAVARNTGFSYSNGDFISFLDDDDEYHPHRIDKFVQTIISCDSNIAGVYSGCEFWRNEKKYLTYQSVRSGSHLIETLACRFMFCTGSNIFLKRNVIEELGGFDPIFSRHQDYEFLVRLFQKYNLKALNQILVKKNNDNRYLPSVEQMIDIKKLYLSKFSKIINSLPKRDKDYIFQKNYISIMEHAITSGRWEIAFVYFKKANNLNFLKLNDYLRIFFLIIRRGIL